MSEEQSVISGFLNMLLGQNNNIKGLFVVMAQRLKIPYKSDCEDDLVVKIRHGGKWVPDGGGLVWDYGADYSNENVPDSYNNVSDALAKIHQPTAIWYHNRSMNLVILDKSGEKIGIRSTELRVPFKDWQMGNLKILEDGLRAKITSN